MKKVSCDLCGIIFDETKTTQKSIDLFLRLQNIYKQLGIKDICLDCVGKIQHHIEIQEILFRNSLMAFINLLKGNMKTNYPDIKSLKNKVGNI
jgi:hypothetical protein